MLLPYGRQSISDEDVEAVVRALRSDWLTIGPSVDAFEMAISDLSGGHAVVSCTSGTAALHIAYSSLEVGPGDDVVTSPMTFVSTASTASILGATVLFADVEDKTGLIDPAAVSSLVNERTRAITAVDYGGHPCNYDALQPLADSVGAVTIADAAHSIGGFYKGRPVGGLADITTFSFFPTKNITSAEGGAVVVKDPARAQRVLEFHRVGLVRDPERYHVTTEGAWHQEVHEFGLNYRLSDVHAALGLSQLARLDAFKSRRAEIHAMYNRELASFDGVRTPQSSQDADPVWHLYPLRILGGRRREVFDKMRADGIGVQVNYLPVYWHPAYARLGYRRGMCPVAESMYQEELSLPMFPDLSESQVVRVLDSLERALA